MYRTQRIVRITAFHVHAAQKNRLCSKSNDAQGSGWKENKAERWKLTKTLILIF